MDLKVIGSLFLILATLKLTSGAFFNISNNCLYTVWAAAIPGGGKELNPGEHWRIEIDSNTTTAGTNLIWGRTKCQTNVRTDSISCETGDCDGAFACNSPGSPPYTLAEHKLNLNLNQDEFDISLMNGFNIPMEFKPVNPSGCTGGVKCSGDFNSICPTELTDPGGCNHPCTVFENDQFCCKNERSNCKPTPYTKLFKNICPNVFTTPFDDATSIFTCPTGTDYEVQFCPLVNMFGTTPTGPPTANRSATGNLTVTVTVMPTFNILNNCPFTVWAAAVPGGGRRLKKGEKWDLNVSPKTTQARIWARTGCEFNDTGHGSCQTGDCEGLLQCEVFGAPPNTLAEYALNQPNDLDYFDISLVDGFNVGMDFSPISSECTRGISCRADINGQCPSVLKAPGGCNNPCTVFKTDQYCCGDGSGSCAPTNYSVFFKERCEDAYSYPKDDQTSTFTCPSGTKYKVVFCP